MKKNLIGLISLIGLTSLACMTSAVMVVPEASPTVAVVATLEVGNEAVQAELELLDEWIPESFDFEVCADVLHVRSGPRFGAPVVGYKYRGDLVTVTEFFDGWGMIAPARWVKVIYLDEDCK